MDMWELVAREQVRDTLATYNWSGDAFRLDELAQAFSPDGILELRGGGRYEGRDAIVAFLGGGAGGDDEARRAARRAQASTTGVRRIVRHLLTNTRFLEVTPDRIEVASYFTVVTEIGLDHHGRYRDTLIPADAGWLIRHRKVSTDWQSEDSTMAAPSADR